MGANYTDDQGFQNWKDFDFIGTNFPSGSHSVSVLEGRDSLQVSTEHGLAFFTLRDDSGATREKQIVPIAGVLVIERPRKLKPLDKPADRKVVSIGGQAIH